MQFRSWPSAGWHAICQSLLVAAISMSPAHSQSLAEALSAAYQNNSILAANRATVKATDEGVASAVTALRPSINASLSAEKRFFDRGRINSDSSYRNTLQLTAELLLYDGGFQKTEVEIAGLAVLAARETLREVEQEVLLTTVETYHDVLKFQDFLALEQNRQMVVETDLSAANSRLELGEVTRTDVSLVEARLASVVGDVAKRQGELVIAREGYKAATGTYPVDLEPPPPLPEIPASAEDALAIANQMHPAVLRAKHSVAMADKVVGQTEEKITAPSVYLGGALGRSIQTQGNERFASISINSTIPLYRGGRGFSLLRRAQANAEIARAELMTASRSVSAGVISAWTRVEIAEALTMAREEQAIAAEIAYNGTRKEAALGTRTTLDVLDAEHEFIQARSNQVAAYNDRNVAVYALLASIGLMTAEHLGFDDNLYDPEVNFDTVKDAPTRDHRGNLLDILMEDR